MKSIDIKKLSDLYENTLMGGMINLKNDDSKELAKEEGGEPTPRNPEWDKIARVEDFDQELMDLYWKVVDSGVDEKLAGNWLDGIKQGLHSLLQNNNDPDLQNLGSKF